MRSFCFSLLAALATASTDEGYELLFTSAPEEFTNKCVDLGKALPSWAEGDFIVSSIGLLEYGEGNKLRHFTGMLDAFGKLHKYTLKGKQVCATFRIMETGFFNKSKKEGTIGPGLLFYETEPPRSCGWNPLCNLFAPNDNSYVVTFEVDDVMYSTTDSGFMVTLDRESLNVTGSIHVGSETGKNFQLSILAAAHPMAHPTTGKWVDFLGSDSEFHLAGKTTITPYMMNGNPGDPSKRQTLTEFVMETPPYMHSFGMTDNYMVFPHMPVKYNLAAVFGKTMDHALQPIEIKGDSDPNNAFYVAPIDGSAVQIHPLPESHKLYYIHTVNSFENESGLVLDMTTSDVNPFTQTDLVTVAGQMDKAKRDATSDHVISVTRFVLPVKDSGKAVTSQLMSDPRKKTEFPKTNPLWNRKKYCFYWAVTWFSDYKTYGSMAIVKYDMCLGRYVGEWKRDNWYPSEALMIPSDRNGAAEDEGILVFTATDGKTKTSSLMILDSRSMLEISEAAGYPHLPYTAHGAWYPRASDLRKQESTQYV